LSVATHILVPAIPDVDSLEGFGEMLDTVNEVRMSGENPELSILGILFSNVVYQRSTQKEILAQVREEMPDLVFHQSLKSRASVEKARRAGIPIAYFEPSGPSADEYTRVAREILKRVGEESRK